jgi:hypothetical protein
MRIPVSGSDGAAAPLSAPAAPRRRTTSGARARRNKGTRTLFIACSAENGPFNSSDHQPSLNALNFETSAASIEDDADEEADEADNNNGADDVKNLLLWFITRYIGRFFYLLRGRWACRRCGSHKLLSYSKIRFALFI